MLYDFRNKLLSCLVCLIVQLVTEWRSHIIGSWIPGVICPMCDGCGTLLAYEMAGTKVLRAACEDDDQVGDTVYHVRRSHSCPGEADQPLPGHSCIEATLSVGLGLLPRNTQVRANISDVKCICSFDYG